jgi:ribosome maturation protein Sdo1
MSARETEARAKALWASADQKVCSAETRAELAEQSKREIIAEVDAKLQAASQALKQAEQEITAAEDKATATQVRAQLAEAKAYNALEALALVEEVIRKQILCMAHSNTERFHAVA